MKLHPEPIVILGMQRSGTSALAGCLQSLGVYFGKPEMLYPADQNNPSGYFEHRKATVMNLRCLSEYQLHPTSRGRLPENWKEFPESDSLRAELRDFLTSEFDRKGRWGLKQPVTSLVLPLYLDVFDQLKLRPHFIVCVRNPIETMRSEASLDFGDSYRVMARLGDRAIGSWSRYTLGALAELEGRTVTVVSYERLLSSPKDVLEEIVRRHPDWSPDASQSEAANKCVNSTLRHNQSAVSELEAYPSLVGRTYKTVSDPGVDSPEWWQEVKELHREFLEVVDLFTDPLPPAKAGFSWFDRAEQKVVEVPYDPLPRRQTLEISIDAPPDTALNGLLAGRPTRIWIWRCVWQVGSKEIPTTVATGKVSRASVSNRVLKLDGVLEPGQIMVTTPQLTGPYVLKIEFLAVSGPTVSDETSAALASRLEESIYCDSTVKANV